APDQRVAPQQAAAELGAGEVRGGGRADGGQGVLGVPDGDLGAARYGAVAAVGDPDRGQQGEIGDIGEGVHLPEADNGEDTAGGDQGAQGGHALGQGDVVQGGHRGDDIESVVHIAEVGLLVVHVRGG